jgi:hypothetical protein
MRAKEIAVKEGKLEQDLRNKYQDRINNIHNKYLSRDYSGNTKPTRKVLSDNRRILIDPTNNALKLEQIMGKNIGDPRNQQKRRYQPLSENYRGIENKLSLQVANPNLPSNQNQNQYNMIGRAGSRGSNPVSITPLSDRKDNYHISKLKENYKNSNIVNNGYYVPPTGLNKMAGVNNQRSQPILGGLRNNLGRRYASNQYSVDSAKARGLPPPGITNQKRADLSSAQQKQRINSRHEYNIKPMSAKSPAWWG